MRSLAIPQPSRVLVLAAIAAGLLLGVFWVSMPVAEAGDVAPPVAEEVVYIDSDVEEGGYDGAGASDWIPFAIMLAPFLVLISGLLWLTFRIDRSEGREE